MNRKFAKAAAEGRLIGIADLAEDKVRDAVIEECARAVEKEGEWAGKVVAAIFAKAVRALKRRYAQ